VGNTGRCNLDSARAACLRGFRWRWTLLGFLNICLKNETRLINLTGEIKLTSEDSIRLFLNALVGGVVTPNLRGTSFVDDRDWE
jgi:hypothetical protein